VQQIWDIRKKVVPAKVATALNLLTICTVVRVEDEAMEVDEVMEVDEDMDVDEVMDVDVAAELEGVEEEEEGEAEMLTQQRGIVLK